MIIDQLIMVVRGVIDNVLNVGGLNNMSVYAVMQAIGRLHAHISELENSMHGGGRGASTEKIEELLEKQTKKIQETLDKEHKHFDKRLNNLESECSSIKKEVIKTRHFIEDWRREQLEQKWYDNLESRYLMLKNYCPDITFEDFKFFMYHTEIHHIESPISMEELISVFKR